MKKGDKVYRVVPWSEGPDTPDTWRVQERVIKSVGKEVHLTIAFNGLDRRQFDLNAIGTSFFLTPAEAVRAFAAQQQRAIEYAKSLIQFAEEALAWAVAYAFDDPTNSAAMLLKAVSAAPPVKRDELADLLQHLRDDDDDAEDNG